MAFKDRYDGGKQLVERLTKYKGDKDALVLGLARGGVITASAVAAGLHLPLNVVVVRKIGAPGEEELALGAIAETGEGIFNEHLISLLGVSSDYLKREIEKQKNIVKVRLSRYRSNCPASELKGKTVILVDDGIATGASMRVAIQWAKSEGAKKIVLAVPVAAPDSLKSMEKEVDEVVCLFSPVYFEAVGSFYKFFDQTEDAEIIRLLSSSNQR
ncbi:MAG TPA: phosphoribosyltransferase [Rhabdochlamydiaceae bacterium]